MAGNVQYPQAATVNASSGTITSLTVTSIKFGDGTVQVSSPTAGGGGSAGISRLATAALTSQGADISMTALFTAPDTGLYQINAYMVTTASDAGASTTLTLEFSYTDDAQVQTPGPMTIDLTNVGSNPVSVSQASTYTFEAHSGTTVSYLTTGGGTYGAARYSLYLTAYKVH